MSRTRAILQTLERMENKENARSVSSLPYGIKIGEYRELPEGRKHVRLWAEGVEPWFKLAGWRVEGHEAHMKCILYLSTRLAASKSASGWWRGQRQLQAQEAAAAAAAQHGGVPMDLGYTQAADSDEDDAAERTTRRRAPTPGRGPRDGVCWDCGKPGHFRGAPGCPKHNGGAASASGSKVNGSRR